MPTTTESTTQKKPTNSKTTSFSELDAPIIPIEAARILLEEYARNNVDQARPYISLSKVVKGSDGNEWQVSTQEPEREVRMRENISDRDKQDFEAGIHTPLNSFTVKGGQKFIKLMCRGNMAGSRMATEAHRKALDEYANAERHRRVLERQAMREKQAHDVKYPADRFEEEGQTPPAFVFAQQDVLDRRVKEVEAALLKVNEFKEQAVKPEKVTHVFRLDESPRFTVL